MAVQAVALFGAIAAAISVPLYVAYRERKKRAKAIGEFVAADYFGFRMSVELLWNKVESGAFNEPSPTRPYEAMFKELRLEMPDVFLEALRLAIEADTKALKPCTDMIGTLIVYNNTVDQFAASSSLTEGWWPKNLTALTTSLGDVRNHCARAWSFFARSPDPVPGVLEKVAQNER